MAGQSNREWMVDEVEAGVDAGYGQYVADEGRYDNDGFYQRCGRSGLRLPRLALGLWHNFGGDRPSEEARRMLLNSFDAGITHFDLANNYGPPPGSAEENFGTVLRNDLASYRDELIISSKAGYDMWPGPYGEWGSRKYLIASLDQSLARMGLDYVDIFYSHRYDPDTPLEETMGALDHIVRSGKALYVGISSYGPEMTKQAADLLAEMGTPCLIHQPSYSMFNRWVENGLLDVLGEAGIGCIAFSPLAQGLLTSKYLDGVPEDARVNTSGAFSSEFLNDTNLARVRALNAIAVERGQTLAQMAVSWVLRDPRMTTALIGASRWSQIAELIPATDAAATDFSVEELAAIDEHAVDGSLNLWQASSDAG